MRTEGQLHKLKSVTDNYHNSGIRGILVYLAFINNIISMAFDTLMDPRNKLCNACSFIKKRLGKCLIP